MDAGLRTWVLISPMQVRPSAPPDQEATHQELQEHKMTFWDFAAKG
jgi:hypothetical protein